MAGTWTKGAQNNGPISQNRESSQYTAHYFGHFGGPGKQCRVRGALSSKATGSRSPVPLVSVTGTYHIFSGSG